MVLSKYINLGPIIYILQQVNKTPKKDFINYIKMNEQQQINYAKLQSSFVYYVVTRDLIDLLSPFLFFFALFSLIYFVEKTFWIILQAFVFITL